MPILTSFHVKHIIILMDIPESSEIQLPIKDQLVENDGHVIKLKPLLLIALFVFIGLITLIAGFLVHSQNHSKTLVNKMMKRTSSIPSSTVDSILVFQKFDKKIPSLSNTTSITDSSGNILSRFQTTNSDSTFDTAFTDFNNYISYSSGLLASNELYNNTTTTETKYSLYESTGKIANVSPTLTTFLNPTATSPARQPFIIDNIFLLGFNTSNSRDYNMTNLLTGESKILFTVSQIGSSLDSNSKFIPQDVSPDGSTISFIVDDEQVGSFTITDPSVISYNLLKGTYIIYTIPSTIISNNLGILTSSGAFQASWDGNLLLYPTISQTPNGEGETLHIYNLLQKKDIILPNQNTSSVSGGHYVYFSPDNKFVLANTGNQPWEIYSTKTGKVVKNFDEFGDPDYNSLQPMGWINNNTLAYTISTTTTANDFSGPTASYSYNVAKNTSNEFPNSLGELAAVLVKSSSITEISVPTVSDTYVPTPSVAVTPPEAVVPSVDESSWKTYRSTTDNATFRYPPDWTVTTPAIQSSAPNNTDQIALKSPDGVIQINWVTNLSGFGGGCDSSVSVGQGGCPLVIIVSKNPIPTASGSFLVSGIITYDDKTYEPFLAVQNADGLTTSKRTMGYDMFSIGSGKNGGTLFSTSAAYAHGPSLSQQDALTYLNKPNIQTAEEIFMSLSY